MSAIIQGPSSRSGTSSTLPPLEISANESSIGKQPNMPAPAINGLKVSIVEHSNVLEQKVDVLVGEDNVMQQRIIERLGKQLPNVNIEIAPDGNEVVKRARSKSYDVIFMDLMMPGQDGAEAVKEIRAFDKNTPIIVQSDSSPGTVKKRFDGLSVQGNLEGKLRTKSQLEEQLKRLRANSI